ncbi:hypothetical protein BLNAU_21770 [Blattamonas nauphoetae]|uniref:Transposase n=1 Tax=Blattamonas nauphoetae TaxID=2049346 RepID=A0ABQ9WVF2_9EUKA|nr:hypothetical protein BLNAU_21770 [Blattamonas nauphoetae]
MAQIKNIIHHLYTTFSRWADTVRKIKLQRPHKKARETILCLFSSLESWEVLLWTLVVKTAWLVCEDPK